MVQGLPDSQPGYRWVLQVPDDPPRRRRSPWPWIITLIVIAVLAAAAWFIGEWLARDVIERTVRAQAVESLGLPADQQIDVEVEGLVLPQLLSGSLDDVRVSAPDVAYGAFAGDVAVHARGVPLSAEGTLDAATAVVRLDEAQLRTLLGTVEGLPVDSVALAAGYVTMATEVVLFGNAFPIGVALDVGVADGAVTLQPATFDVAGTEISADGLRSQFGVLAEVALRTWEVCIAEHMPAGLTLTGVDVADAGLTATFDIAPAILNDPTLREPGVCAP